MIELFDALVKNVRKERSTKIMNLYKILFSSTLLNSHSFSAVYLVLCFIAFPCVCVSEICSLLLTTVP